MTPRRLPHTLCLRITPRHANAFNAHVLFGASSTHAATLNHAHYRAPASHAPPPPEESPDLPRYQSYHVTSNTNSQSLVFVIIRSLTTRSTTFALSSTSGPDIWGPTSGARRLGPDVWGSTSGAQRRGLDVRAQRLGLDAPVSHTFAIPLLTLYV